MTTIVARASNGLLATSSDETRLLPGEASIDGLLMSTDPFATLDAWYEAGTPSDLVAHGALLTPVESQEVWAAGVTYHRSRTARMSESSTVGADHFYDLVYEADRPELFFKATPNRVVGPDAGVRIRRDSSWNVPEPELTLAISANGQVIGYTIGNDMSSRSIEGENPLYLPQAKIYSACASVGPWLTIGDEPGPESRIEMTISRNADHVFEGATRFAELRRSPAELVEYLFRDNEFPNGVFLMTGTGIVPPDDFTLMAGDLISITIDGLGTLTNHVIA